MALEVTALLLWAISLPLALTLLRWRDRRNWPAWEALYGFAERDARDLRRSLATRTEAIAAVLAAVPPEQAASDHIHALELLRLSVRLVEAFVRDLTGKLRAWSEVARALMALAPVEPLTVADVRLLALRLLVLGWTAAHAAATTSRERFLLRGWVLQRALRLLLFAWRRLRMPPERTAPWRSAETLKADLQALSRASAESYQVLVASAVSTFEAKAI